MNIKTAKYLVSFALALWASALSAQTHWSVDCHRYQYDMTVYFVLKDGSRIVESQDAYEVAAFVGDECRGVGQFLTYEGTNYGYLRIRSNQQQGETITFKVYLKDINSEVDVENYSITFASQGVMGLPSAPVAFNFIPFILGDVNNDQS